MQRTAIAAVALLAAVAAGFTTGRVTVPEPKLEIPEWTPITVEGAAPTIVVTNTVRVPVTNTMIAASDDTAIEALQVELYDVKQLLAQREEQLAKLQAEEKERDARRRDRSQDWRERMERMREEEPERFAEMEQRREEARVRMVQAVSDRSQFLADLDTQGMSEDERQVHAELITRIGVTEAMIDKIQTQGRPSREDFEVLRDNYRVLDELYQVERDYVLRQVGASMGYEGSESSEFSTYMQDIFDLTSPPRPTGGMSGRGRGGGGGGGGGPGK